MMKKMLIGIFILLIASLSLVSALTASIDKPKMVIWKNITGDELKFQESVIVNNVNSYKVNILVTPLDNFKDLIVIPENNFSLARNQSKEVFYDVTIKKPGEYGGDIMITFSDDNKTEVSVIQRLVVQVGEENSKSNSWVWFVIGLVAILIILAIVMRGKK